MSKIKVTFILDKLEFQYFSFNQLVTSFWLIKESLYRGWEVFISTSDRIFLKNDQPFASLYKTQLIDNNGNLELIKDKVATNINLNDFNIVFYRPDPPIDIDYINSTYILDYIDRSKTLVINDPTGIRKANEKLFINNFPELVPNNVTTSKADIIKEFLAEYGEIIVKPLNKCFGKGVFFLKKDDQNINSIIDTMTNSGRTVVMAQEYLKSDTGGDKRVSIIFGEVIKESVIKISGEGDFKFNAQQDEYFKKGEVTAQEELLSKKIAPRLIKEGLYLVGLDVINNKIIEINVTSPCFFIKEANRMYDVQLEKRIIDLLEAHYNKTCCHMHQEAKDLCLCKSGK